MGAAHKGRQRSRARLLVGGVIAAATLAATACGGDDDDAATAATGTATATEATAATESSDATAGSGQDTGQDTGHTGHTGDAAPVVAVNAVDYAFEDLPATVPVGTRLSLTNTSTAELHEMVVLGPIPPEETRSIEELLAAPEEETAAIQPVTVLVAPPGEEGIAVVGDGTLTEPGRYGVICSIPIGADPAELMAAAEGSGDGPPEVQGGPPHFTAGMFAELVVE